MCTARQVECSTSAYVLCGSTLHTAYSLSYSQRLGDMMSQHIVFCGQCFAHAVYQMLQTWAGKVFDKITLYQ